MIARAVFVIFALVAPLALGGCQPPAQLLVKNAYVQLSPDPDMPSSGYFTVQGGADNVTLMAVTAPAAQRVAMHETIDDGGISRMVPVEKVNIPSRADVAFVPGGRHLMIFGIDGGARRKGTLALQFIFSNGDRILVDAKLQDIAGNQVKSEPIQSEKAASTTGTAKDPAETEQ